MNDIQEGELVFWKAIRNARKASDLTRQEFADRLEVGYSRVRQLEVCSYGAGISEKLFLRVAKALDITPLELLGYAYEEAA